jgi:hypothetical protein
VLIPIVDAFSNTRDYARLPELLFSITDLATRFTWVFLVVGIIALAIYVGPIRTRLGWAIVAVGVVVAVARISLTINSLQPVLSDLMATPTDTLPLLTGSLGQLNSVAWALLLAVVLERRMPLLSIGAGAGLAGGAFAAVAYLGLQSAGFGDSSGVLPTAEFAIGLALSLTTWLGLIGGVIKELPAQRAISQGSLSVSQ